jgi:hypothetical protein
MRGAIVALVIGCSSGASAPPAAVVDAGVETSDAPAPAPQTLTARFAITEPFERSLFGLTSPAKSTSKTWELHVEAVHGGDPGCPSEMSATPDRSLVIAGLPKGFDTKRTYAEGVRATLLDFKGTLTKEPILRATAVTATPGSSSDAAISFDLDATFPGGTISGHIYATHCDSMDDL